MRTGIQRFCVWPLVLFGLWAIVPSTVNAADRSLVWVLDGSNSMWGRIGEEPKIAEAKAVMRELLAEVPDEVEIGFVAYGHRRPGDCRDIETMAELGTPASGVASAVERITPRGKTPITESLRHAAGLLTERELPSTIVLVSDGIETCEGDPCALARQLANQNAELVVHTVGLGVDDAATRQLQCVAEAGGGNHYRADNPQALRKALFAAAEQAPAPPEAAESETKQMQLQVGLGTIVIEPASWVPTPPYYWQARDAESGESQARTNKESLRVRTGDYRIVWRQSEHAHPDVPLSGAVSVPADETVTVPVDTGLRILPPDDMAPPYRMLFVDGDSGEELVWRGGFHGKWESLVLPAGSFDVVWHQNEHGSSPVSLGTVTVAPGRLNEMTVGSGFRLDPADWVGKPYRFSLVDSESDSALRWAGGYGSPFATQIAPPGEYRLVYQQTEHGHAAVDWGQVTIEDGAIATIRIASGVRFLPSDESDLPYRVYFTSLDTGEETVWNAGFQGEWESVPLPPGRYRLDWWEDKRQTQRMTLLDEFTIPSDTLVEFEL